MNNVPLKTLNYGWSNLGTSSTTNEEKQKKYIKPMYK